MCSAAALLAALAGCIKRTERITVHQDGRADLSVEFNGDLDDFSGGDPMLAAEAPGWTVTEERKTHDDGKIEMTRTAQRSVPPGTQIPDRYALPSSENADVCLTFPTTVTIEKRGDGAYYHFRRVYTAREWARYEYHQEHVFKDDLKELVEQDPDSLTPDQQRQVILGFIEVEKMKAVEHARAAGEELSAVVGQDARLAVEAAVRGVYDSISADWAVDLMTAPDKGERIAAEAERIVGEAKAAIRAALSREGVPPSVVERFAAAHDRHMRRYAVAQDLGDEAWEVRVRLPGVIVGHNGDKLDGGEVVWAFEAAALTDRDLVLMATSRVAAP
ncbi:MAG: hypothetical protein C4547_03290 [Phycisphaerales bacterium]|nr:MAG: hypothetical protein C4547_03290 [Phycisphaerales bacterium]